MAANQCAAFFAQGERDVKKLPQSNICVQWESSTASPDYSPGPVNDEEEVRRSLVRPTHITAEGEPDPAAFSDMWTHGLSVDRTLYRSHEESLFDALKRVNAWNIANQDKPQRALQAFAIVRVQDLREVKVDGNRALAIYDTAIATNISHADVCAIASHTKKARKDLRTTLWDLMRKKYHILNAGEASSL